MSGFLDHSPANILLEWMLDEGLVDAPSSADWPGFLQNVDERYESYVVVYDTDSRLSGKVHLLGETQQHYGIQIQVRSPDPDEAHSKVSEIFTAFDAASREPVTIAGEADGDPPVIPPACEYIIDAITPTSGAIRAGKEQPEDYLWLWTANFVISIKQVGP